MVVVELDRMAYRSAWALQRRLQARLISARRTGEAPLPPHVLLLVEHPPVYTLGKSGNPSNMLASPELLRARGAELVHIDRGGDITFHGPGQLVGYPIFDLNRVFTDIHRYLRSLEEAIITTCGDYGVSAGRVDGRTGVWVGPDARGLERKICAMGIRCSRWVTMHGFALNVNTDLSFFDLMIPCGIADRSTTSLAAELGRPVPLGEVAARVAEHLATVFGLPIQRFVSAAEAAGFVDDFAPATTDPRDATSGFEPTGPKVV